MRQLLPRQSTFVTLLLKLWRFEWFCVIRTTSQLLICYIVTITCNNTTVSIISNSTLVLILYLVLKGNYALSKIILTTLPVDHLLLIQARCVHVTLPFKLTNNHLENNNQPTSLQQHTSNITWRELVFNVHIKTAWEPLERWVKVLKKALFGGKEAQIWLELSKKYVTHIGHDLRSTKFLLDLELEDACAKYEVVQSLLKLGPREKLKKYNVSQGRRAYQTIAFHTCIKHARVSHTAYWQVCVQAHP